MTGTRVRIVVASVAAVLIVSAFSAAVSASPDRGATPTIRGVGSLYSSPRWSPKRVGIEERSRVKWLAVSDDHNLSAYGGNWAFNRPLPEGASVTRRFADSGTYLFRCRIHSTLANGRCQGMCGKVVVR
jgi:plastocyanin